MVALLACDRPGVPPSPVDPARPKMSGAKQMLEASKAIFTYAKPAGKPSSSLEPTPEEVKGGRLQV